jgi:hypothetical protein
MLGFFLVEWGIWIVYLASIAMGLYLYRNTKKDVRYRFFIPAFFLKVFGGFAFAYIYVNYYGFGDTFLYHRGASVLAETLVTDPGAYFRLLSSTNNALPPDLVDFSQQIAYSRGAEEWFMVKLISPLSLMTFNSYLTLTLFMSTLSFWGSWKLYLVFSDLIKKSVWIPFLAAFLIPSTLFWGGGIMKDTITLVGIYYVIYVLYFNAFKGEHKIQRYILAVVAAYIVFRLKGYIILAFIPSMLLGINQLVKNKITSTVFRRFIGIALLTSILGVLYIGPQYLSETSSKYNLESLEWRVKGFHTWHTDVGGSTYNFGDVEYTALGILQKIPAAINVTFFRPYLWEVSSPVVLIAALESLVLFALTLYMLFYFRLRIFKVIWQQPLLLTFLVYSLIFGFVVGFTSYNFGALARYKIPIYSLFVFVILYLFHLRKEEKKSG